MLFKTIIVSSMNTGIKNALVSYPIIIRFCYSRGLQVGHSSGPDHCVLAESPYSVDQSKDEAIPNVMMNIGHHQIGLTMIAQQSPVSIIKRGQPKHCCNHSEIHTNE